MNARGQAAAYQNTSGLWRACAWLERRPAAACLILLLVALLLRLGLAAAGYTSDLHNFQNGDYTLYRIGAEDFLLHGNFANSLFLVRPPAFPILIALLGLNGTAVLIVNIVLGALVAPLTYIFARLCALSFPAALLAALIVALDPPSIVYSAYLGAEPLANATLLAALILLLASLRRETRRAGLLLAGCAGIALALSMLARPAAYLLWLVIGLWALVSSRRKWLVVAAFVLISAAACVAWVVHNGIVFGNYTFSTIGTYNLVYYRAASVLSHGAGLGMDDTYAELSRRIEARLGHDTSGVEAGTRHGHYAVTAQLQPVMQSVALEVFTTYPLIYLLTIPLGLYRILGSLEVASRGLMLIALAWNLGLVLATAVGLLLLYRAQQRRLFWLILLTCAYFVGGTLLVQTSGIDTRARTMITPLLALAAAFGLERASAALRRRGLIGLLAPRGNSVG